MKINFLVWNGKKCGGNKVIFEYANRLKLKGHEVIITFITPSNIDWFDLKVNVCSFWKFKWFKMADIVIATFWPTAYLSLLFPAKKKLYFVQGWETEFYNNILLSLFVKVTFRLPLRIITISLYLKDKISQYSKSQIVVIPNGIDLKQFKPDTNKKSKIDKKRILSVVSNYEYSKGLDILDNLVKQLKQIHPKLYFVLVSVEKKPYSNNFDEFISNPPLKEIIRQYQIASVLLTTSRVEGFSLPPIEAMACGCPVIMTDSGGSREYARNNINCLLAKNSKEILDKKMLRKVLENNKTRNILINNGLKTVANFSWVKSTNLFQNALKY